MVDRYDVPSFFYNPNEKEPLMGRIIAGGCEEGKYVLYSDYAKLENLQKATDMHNDRLELYMNKAFGILEMYGVPKERARYVSNGIMVLATRYDREIQGLQFERDKYKEALEKIASKTEDVIPPFRAMGTDQLASIAKQVLKPNG